MRPASRHLLVLVAALLLAGCGDADVSGTSTAPARSPADDDTAEEAPPASSASGQQDGEAIARSAPDLAAGRGLDRLVAAYAPASARVSFLVAAETLRQDAVESNAGDAIEVPRAGQVRIESVRMFDERRGSGVLVQARRRVEGVVVSTDAQQRVRTSMLEAIDARSRAMVELRAALTAIGRELGDSIVEQRVDIWEASWNASLRAAREATTAMQEERAALGLVPAPEESIR